MPIRKSHIRATPGDIFFGSEKFCNYPKLQGFLSPFSADPAPNRARSAQYIWGAKRIHD